MRNSAVLAASLLLLAGLAVRAADEKAIVVKMHRDERVGDLVEEHTVGEHSATVQRVLPTGATTRQTTTDKFDLTATVECLEVLPSGASKRSLLIVKKFLGTSGEELVAGGTRIEITRGEKETSFNLPDGGSLNKPALAALQALYIPANPKSPDDDQSMGSEVPHKPGDSWDIHPGAIAADLKLHDEPADPSDITGKVSLKTLDVANGIPVMHLALDMRINNLKVKIPAWDVDVCSIHNLFDEVLPLDPSLPPLEMNEQKLTQIHCSAASGEKMIVDDEFSKRAIFTWLKHGK